jgi:hypothetical protein
MTKKYQILGVGLLVCAVYGAIAASASLAAEWLVGGNKILAALTATNTAEVLFEDSGSGLAIVCSMLFDGTIGPGGGDNVTSILTLAGVEVTAAAPLLCKREAVCEESATEIEWSPVGLPWKTTLILLTTLFEDLFFSMKYKFACLVLKVLVSDECTTPNEAGGGSGFLATNVAGGVELSGKAIPSANCTAGGNGSGVIQFVSSLVTSPEGLVAVSE